MFTEIIPGNTKHPCNILMDVLLAIFCLCLAPSRMILASVGYFCFTCIPSKRAISFFGFIFSLLLSFMKWFLFLIFIYLFEKKVELFLLSNLQVLNLQCQSKASSLKWKGWSCYTHGVRSFHPENYKTSMHIHTQLGHCRDTAAPKI